MKNDAWIATRQSVDNGCYEGSGQSRNRSNSDLACRGIVKEFDVLYAATQLIEYGYATIEQCTAVFRRLNPSPRAIEQSNTESRLQLCNRSRNGRLGGVEKLSCFAHAAGLHDGHEDVEVLQLHTASDAVAQLHVCTISLVICNDQIIALYVYDWVRYPVSCAIAKGQSPKLRA